VNLHPAAGTVPHGIQTPPRSPIPMYQHEIDRRVRPPLLEPCRRMAA
jgi:hypothetical protein